MMDFVHFCAVFTYPSHLSSHLLTYKCITLKEMQLAQQKHDKHFRVVYKAEALSTGDEPIRPPQHLPRPLSKKGQEISEWDFYGCRLSQLRPKVVLET